MGLKIKENGKELKRNNPLLPLADAVLAGFNAGVEYQNGPRYRLIIMSCAFTETNYESAEFLILASDPTSPVGSTNQPIGEDDLDDAWNEQLYFSGAGIVPPHHYYKVTVNDGGGNGFVYELKSIDL